MTVRGGYHGDTTGAMSVTDPVSGMHRLFTGLLPKHHFLPRPEVPFGQPVGEAELAAYQAQFQQHAETTAALILEPIVQGAGGMRFYSADYLHELRTLCDRHDVLLIFDEIATGFGRTGKLFATEHAKKGSGTFNSPGASPLFQPDILCVGKALTGGTMTLSAVLATRDVAEGISATGGVLMHGPTFMGNPLACAAACASIDLLLDGDWQGNIARLERCMREGLTPCRESDEVADVRVLGGIGVVQTRRPVDVAEIQRRFVDRGVWIRPFGRLIYLMPPYMISEEEIATLCEAIREAVGHSNCFS